MSRIVVWVAALALVVSALVAAPVDADEPGEHERHTFTNAAGSRDYLVHVPDRPGPMPLVVFLHGCGSDPLAYGLTAYADQRGFVVAYPVQDRDVHAGGCWRWTEDTSRDVGEASIIAGITREVQSMAPVDPARTYLAGHSAGSGMTRAVAASYPDLFAAVGMVAGCGFRVCADPSGKRVRGAMGEHAQPVPAYIVWGTDDAENPYLDGRSQLLEWLAANDLADDGRANLSVPRLPTGVELRLGKGTVPTFTVEHYRTRVHCTDIDFATGFGVGHIPDFDWPSVFPAMTDFLLAHPAAGCG
jgi:poly(hydroxyalkanoate) depolymerase family esterase